MNKRTKNIIATTAVTFLASAILTVVTITILSNYQPKPPTPVATKMTKIECELDANRKYTETIKVQGTPINIGGKLVSSLSTEAWQLIEDQRKSDIEKCSPLE